MLDRLLSPRASGEETITRGRVVNLLALVLIVMLPLYTTITAITTPGEITAGGFGALGAAFLLGVGCYVACKRGRVRLAGNVLVIGLFVAISLYMLDPGNTILDINAAPALYLVAIIPAGLVIHPLASFALTTVGVIYILGLLNLAPPPAYTAYLDPAGFMSSAMLLFALAYILSAVAWIFSRGVADSLAQVRDQNQRLQDLAREMEDKRQTQIAIGQQILDVAERLSEYSTRQARGSSREAAAVAQVSTATEELNQAAREIAQNAGLVSQGAQATLDGAHNGQEILALHGQAMDTIHDNARCGASQAEGLKEQLKQINRVATIISSIASQIQLVAFNATLEAADAGDAGKRFGVVASEVKNLANDSLSQAKQVAQTIHQVQEAGEAVVVLSGEQARAVETGTELTGRSRDANQAIIGLAAQMAERTQQIQLATAQQQQASEQVLDAMREIKTVADRWVVSSHQMDTLVSSLQALAAQLS